MLGGVIGICMVLPPALHLSTSSGGGGGGGGGGGVGAAAATVTAGPAVADSERLDLLDSANAPIFGIDANGLVNEWNRKAAAITGARGAKRAA